jgi:hypothetical protein
MPGFEEKVLGGIATLLLVLIVGTVFGRLHGSSNGAEVKPIGDRVACGILALPLISLAVRLAFSSAHLAFVLLAPLPLAVYVVLLAGTDENINWAISTRYFTLTLILASMVIYVAMAVCVWLLRT